MWVGFQMRMKRNAILALVTSLDKISSDGWIRQTLYCCFATQCHNMLKTKTMDTDDDNNKEMRLPPGATQSKLVPPNQPQLLPVSPKYTLNCALWRSNCIENSSLLVMSFWGQQSPPVIVFGPDKEVEELPFRKEINQLIVCHKHFRVIVSFGHINYAPVDANWLQRWRVHSLNVYQSVSRDRQKYNGVVFDERKVRLMLGLRTLCNSSNRPRQNYHSRFCITISLGALTLWGWCVRQPHSQQYFLICTIHTPREHSTRCGGDVVGPLSGATAADDD